MKIIGFTHVPKAKGRLGSCLDFSSDNWFSVLPNVILIIWAFTSVCLKHPVDHFSLVERLFFPSSIWSKY